MSKDIQKPYRNNTRKAVLLVSAISVAIFIVAVYSLSQSSLTMSMGDAYGALIDRILGKDPDTFMKGLISNVVWNDNMPRTVSAIIVGCTLSVGGAVMQSITRNPLADPYTIGISSAALFGMVLALSSGICIVPWLDGDMALQVNAFAFALIPATVILFVSAFKKLSPLMMVLIGIGIMYMFSAFTTFIKFNADPESLHEIYEWQIGSLTRADWSAVLPLTVMFIVVSVFSMLYINRINVLSTGDSMSHSLGVDPSRTRMMCFLLVSFGTAICVCYTGTIGFVGLIAPHIGRLFVGSNNKLLVPVSAVIGALVVLGSDCIVRMLPGPGLPMGVITALIGSPIFLYFLFRNRRTSAWS